MTRKELAREIYIEMIKAGEKTTLNKDQFVEMTVKGIGCLKPESKRELQRQLRMLRNNQK